MTDSLLREQIRAVHVEIHRLRRHPPHPFRTKMMELCEISLADLYYARQQLKCIEARRQLKQADK